MIENKGSILYVAKSPQSYPASGGRTRIVSVAKLHQGFGYHTTILCFVSLGFFLNRPRYLFCSLKRLSKEAGCKVFYFPELPTLGNSYLLKIQQELSIRVLRGLFLSGFNILHGHGIESAWLCLKARRKSSLLVVSDIHGATAEETMFRMGVTAEHHLIKRLNLFERELYQQTNLCVFVSMGMVNYVNRKFGLLPSNYLVIPCATEPFLEKGTRVEIRKELGLFNDLAFVYLGSFRKYQMAKETIQLFKQISEQVEDVVLVIYTAHTREFELELHQQGLDKKKYRIKALERSEVQKYLEGMDIGLMLREDDIINKVASPTKFSEYLMAGLPVITTPFVGDFSQMVEENNVGVSIPNIEISEKLITFIYDVKNKGSNYREKCKDFATNNLSWNSFANSYNSTLESLMSKK